MKFHLFKIPFKIKITYLVLLAYVSGIIGNPSKETLLIAVIATVSLIIHELGHALAARYYQLNPQVEMHGFGGTTYHDSSKISLKQQMLIVFWGPAAQGLVLLAAFLVLNLTKGLPVSVIKPFYLVVYINKFWLLLNLIPVCPLDGGQLLEKCLQLKFKEKGLKVAEFIGAACFFIIIPILIYKGMYLFSIGLSLMALSRYRKIFSKLPLVPEFLKLKTINKVLIVSFIFRVGSMMFEMADNSKNQKNIKSKFISEQINFYNKSHYALANILAPLPNEIEEKLEQDMFMKSLTNSTADIEELNNCRAALLKAEAFFEVYKEKVSLRVQSIINQHRELDPVQLNELGIDQEDLNKAFEGVFNQYTQLGGDYFNKWISFLKDAQKYNNFLIKHRDKLANDESRISLKGSSKRHQLNRLHASAMKKLEDVLGYSTTFTDSMRKQEKDLAKEYYKVLGVKNNFIETPKQVSPITTSAH